MKCPRCQTEMLQKNRVLLLIVGLGLMTSPALTLLSRYFWPPAILLTLTGVYLLVWTTVGKGQWCRTCKKFGLC